MKSLSLLFGVLLLAASFAAAQSTTNNTSACSANGVPTAGCNGVGNMPYLGNPSNSGLQTTTVDPVATNVSRLSIKSLLYSGTSTRLMIEYQPWFCNTSDPCNGHDVIGMEESNAAQVLTQAQWMKTLGADVTDVDYYGCGASCGEGSGQAYNLSVTTALASAIAANPSTTPKFEIMLDQGAFDSTGTGQCAPASGDQSSCLIAAIETQIDYLAKTWLFQSYYEINAANGHPIVLYFIDQSKWPDTNFSTVFSAVASHATSGNSCGSGCTYSQTVDFVDENAGAFSESGIAGGYAWPQPPGYSSTNQFCWQGNPCGFNYLANFYSTARANSSKIAIGVLYKGFDDYNAAWGSNRVIAQQCGQVLGFTAGAISTAGYSSSSQLQYVQLATWNDYEEASEVETGIQNCISVNQPSISGSTLSWSLTKSDATYASTSTINSFSIYTGTTAPTTVYASGISPTATSYYAPSLSPGQGVWVYMVGGPLIQNALSPEYAPAYSTLTVTTSGAGTVASSPSGISCPSTCSAPFPTGTVVTLTATPGGGSTFSGWLGAGCSGTGSCVVTLNSNVTVTALFTGSAAAGITFAGPISFSAPATLGSIAIPPPPAPLVDDLYVAGCATFVCSSPSWGTSDATALLPTQALNTNPSVTPSNGSVVSITSAAQLTSTLAAMTTASCGNVYQLSAGATFSGNFTIPGIACPLNAWITIETSAIASLPAYSARTTESYTDAQGNTITVYVPQMSPCYSGVTSLPGRPPFPCPATPGTYTAQLVTPNSSPALTFTAGASSWRFIGLEITRTPGTGFVSELTRAEVGISNIVFDRVWAHGDEQEDETESFINTSADSNMAIVDYYMSDFACISVAGTCTQSHPFYGSLNVVNSTPESNLKIVNGFCESAGQCFIAGGGKGNTTLQNIEFRLPLMFKPQTWNPSCTCYDGGVGGNPYEVVDTWELKNAQYVLLEGSQMVNDWGGFSQSGVPLIITPKDQSSCTNCFVSNVTVRYNEENAAAYFGQFDMVDTGTVGALAAAGNSWSVHDNVADGLGYSTCYGCTTQYGMQIMEANYISNSAQVEYNVNISHNTIVYTSNITNYSAGTLEAAILMGGVPTPSAYSLYGITWDNNVIAAGSSGTENTGGGSASCAYGVGGGTPMLSACWTTYAVTGNCLVNNGSGTWPSGNTLASAYTNVFTSYNSGDAGNYVLASSSPCKGTGTGGSDPGAGLTALASVLAGNAAP